MRLPWNQQNFADIVRPPFPGFRRYRIRLPRTVECTTLAGHAGSFYMIQFQVHALHDWRTFPRDPKWSKSEADCPLISIFLSLHRYPPWFDMRDSASPNSGRTDSHSKPCFLPFAVNLWLLYIRAHVDMQNRGKPGPIYRCLQSDRL